LLCCCSSSSSSFILRLLLLLVLLLLESGLVVLALGKNFEQNFYIFSFLLRVDLVVIAVERVGSLDLRKTKAFVCCEEQRMCKLCRSFADILSRTVRT
jgi:hypothetical protein